MKNKPIKEIAIYQAKNGAIEFRGDFEQDTIWASQADLALLYEKDQSVISRHINGIFKDEEVDQKSNMQKMHIPNSDKPITLYSLDIVLAVGYRTNSSKAIEFRKWATKTLKQHLIEGYTINKKRIGKNYENFMKVVVDVKALLPAGNKVKTEDILELISAFANTWFSLDAYDKSSFPKKGVSKKSIQIEASELTEALSELKEDLISKKQATELFGQENNRGNIEGIVGNVFQSVFGSDVYPTLEEKAAHLLYFMVKNHPFTDGNKRSGAFAFIWFLRKARLLRVNLSPEALTAITLLVAESNPKDKEKMVGLVLLLINGKYE